MAAAGWRCWAERGGGGWQDMGEEEGAKAAGPPQGPAVHPHPQEYGVHRGARGAVARYASPELLYLALL